MSDSVEVQRYTAVALCSRITAAGASEEEASVLHECVLSLKVEGVPFLEIACTPTYLEELVVGRLFSEGLIEGADEIASLAVDEEALTASVSLRSPRVPARGGYVRHLATTGDVCTTVRFEVLESALASYPATAVDVDELFALSELFEEDTPLHALTSGTHSARVAVDGRVRGVFEDIGRHNALDKAVGWMLLRGVPGSRVTVFSSGRVPVDMARKAVRARIGVLATKAAPTDQAIACAKRYGLRLVCLAKEGSMRVFA